MTIKKVNPEWFAASFAFTFYSIITSYKLTHASLWFDEAVEYWFSKVMFGQTPVDAASNAAGAENMYDRIISTYQPPLYNVIMHFWLKISDHEWWFRFFGVVAGFFAMVAIFKTVQLLSKSIYAASFAVIISSCIYRLLYYWQECSEYCLMLAGLSWAFYYWIKLIIAPCKKTLISFIILSIISVYSQYGAAFPIASMIILAFISVMSDKDKPLKITITLAYVISFVFTALPLYFLFMKKQLEKQLREKAVLTEFKFEGNPVSDVFRNLFKVFKWNFFSYFNDVTVTILLSIFIICLISALVFGSRLYKLIAVANIMAWCFYYYSVKTGAYSYGDFGNRYNLIFIPIWILSFFAFAINVFNSLNHERIRKYGLSSVFSGAAVCFSLCFCVYSWNAKIYNNWEKENGRKMVQTCYSSNVYESNILVYYGAACAFAYYTRVNEKYTGSLEKNVIYMPWMPDKTSDEYKEYLNEIYTEAWPEEIYLVGMHMRDDFEILADQFTSRGWIREDLVKTAGKSTDCKVVKLKYVP